MNNTRLDAFKTAGELFGRIQDQLGFGILTMRFGDPFVQFIWTFNAIGGHRYSEWKLDLMQLHFDDGHRLEHWADYIVARWKHDHKYPEKETA